MKLVLDTHAFVWLLSNPEKLSKPALNAIETAKKSNGLYVSSISIWEIAMLVQKKRLVLTLDVDQWIEIAERIPYLNFQHISNEIALASVSLPKFKYPDPADRMIIATAQSLGAILITRDKRIHRYKGVKSIW